MKVWLCAPLLFLSVIYGVEAYMDRTLGQSYAPHTFSGQYLLMSLFFVACGTIIFGRLLRNWLPFIGGSFLWGGRLLLWWEAICLVTSTVLPVNFSSAAITRSLIFFLLPGEVFYGVMPFVAEMPAIYFFAFMVIVFCALLLWGGMGELTSRRVRVEVSSQKEE